MTEEKSAIGKDKIEMSPALDIFERAGISDASESPKAEGKRDVSPNRVESSDVALERKIKEIQLVAPSSVPVAQTGGAATHTPVALDVNELRSLEDAESRVEKLVEFALAKGVAHAISVAEGFDAHTLDRTHDRLVDNFSEELRRRGLIRDEE